MYEGTRTDICTLRSGSIISNPQKWKQPQRPSWMNGVCAYSGVLYCPPLKGEDVHLTQATTRIHPEEIKLGEISWTQQDKYYMTPLARGRGTSNSQRQNMGCPVPGDAGRGLGSRQSLVSVSIGEDGEVLGTDGGDCYMAE